MQPSSRQAISLPPGAVVVQSVGRDRVNHLLNAGWERREGFQLQQDGVPTSPFVTIFSGVPPREESRGTPQEPEQARCLQPSTPNLSQR